MIPESQACPAWRDSPRLLPAETAASLQPSVRSLSFVLPLRHLDQNRSATALPERRASYPSIAPAPRPSVTPSTLSSLMPGASTYAHSAVLSGVAGYVDAAAFASLIGLFPAHLTGEIVVDAIAFSSGRPSEHVLRLWILPVFVSSVAVASVVARNFRRSGRRALTGLLTLVTFALALFSASDFLARLLHESWNMHLLLGGGCAVAAMGFQNTLMRESLTGSCPTTVMTGNLTQVVIELVNHVLGKLTKPHQSDRPRRARLLPISGALFTFVGCAVLGGFMTRFYGSLAVVLPALFTGVLTYRAWREDLRASPAALAPPAPQLKSVPPEPLPSFEVWPDSLVLRRAEEIALVNPTTRSSTPEQSSPDTRRTLEAERPIVRRTVSGTQLKTHVSKKL